MVPIEQLSDSLKFILQQAISDHKSGRLTEAEQGYRQILQAQPKHAKANFNLGILALQFQAPAIAKPFFLAALESDPSLEQFWVACIEVSLQLGEQESARQLWRKANNALGQKDTLKALEPRLSPDAVTRAESLYQCGQKLRDKGYLLEAEHCWRKAMELQPSLSIHWYELCASIRHLNEAIALVESGKLPQAQALLKSILNHDYSWLAHSALLFSLLHDANISEDEIFSAHQDFGVQAERLWPLNSSKHENSTDPERNLRIGFVSGDLRNHPVAGFLEPILPHLANRPFQLYAYSNYPTEDSVSSRLRSYIYQWRNIYSLDDDTAAQLIRSDGIDILIDLSGHTAYNRLPLFARKPAPVQASWIGYPGTTGLRTVDYYFASNDQIKFSGLQEQFVEELISLPSVISFHPLRDAPEVNTLPALNNGHLTIASFNRLNKINDVTLSLWARVLGTLPSAYLILGGIDQASEKEMLARCLSQGINRQQLIFYPRIELQDYLRLHHKVDLLLDTYPYGGGSTTLYGLWMGVPTLTLAGPTLASRQGLSALYALGLEDFVATSLEDYVCKAVTWSGQLDELSRIRNGLRAELAGNISVNQPSAILADGLKKAWRTIWRRWCHQETTQAVP